VVGIHMGNDSRRNIRQRIRLRPIVICRLYPAHYPEAAYVVNVQHFHSIKGKVIEVYPVPAVGVALQVKGTGFRNLGLRNSLYFSHQRDSRGAQRIAICVGLRDQQTGARIGLQVLRVHRHGADKKYRTASRVQPVGHHRPEREAGPLARNG
jgi:hypothetical protein